MGETYTLAQVLEAVESLKQEKGVDEILTLAKEKIFGNEITGENLESFKTFVRDFCALYFLMKSKFAHIQRDGGERYFEHLKEVVKNTLNLPNPNIEKVFIALAHDSIEDTNKTYEGLAEDFGYTVALAVQAISKGKWERYIGGDVKTEKQAKEQRNTEYFGHMKSFETMAKHIAELAQSKGVTLKHGELEEITKNALDVKFADRIHNLSTQWDPNDTETVRRKVDETKMYFLAVAKETNMDAYNKIQSLILQLEILLSNANGSVGKIIEKK